MQRDTRRPFWSDKWTTGKIGFHLDSLHPSLAHYHLEFFGESPRRVLVPLCGKTLDLSAIEGWGHQVVGVEFVEQAVRSLFHDRPVDWTTVGGAPVATCGQTRVVVTDFFTLTAEQTGPIDRVWDRAALVAIRPERRPDYVRALRGVLAPKAELLVVALEYDQAAMDGPPYSLTESDLRSLFPHAQMTQFEDRELIASEPRFRARGLTSFRSVVWHLRMTG